MADKAKMYVKIANMETLKLTCSWERWLQFLKTAARLYKYNFIDQVMIHAQRPDATACADFELWNKTMRRTVRRGAKGIALVNETDEGIKLRYVFDVSDTIEHENSRSPQLWEMQDSYEIPVGAMLEQIYGSGGNILEEQFSSVARTVVDSYWAEHEQDFIEAIDGSSLQRCDTFDVGVNFKSIATTSILYMLMSRCGMELKSNLQSEEFANIREFDTIDVVKALGIVVSQLAQQVLRQIEIVIHREKNRERGNLYGRNRVPTERGLSVSQSHSAGATGRPLGQIRPDAQKVFEGASPIDLPEPFVRWDTVSSPNGGGQYGARTFASDVARNDGEGRGNARITTGRHAEVGGYREHLQSTNRGNLDDGTHLQISFEDIAEEAENAQASSASSFSGKHSAQTPKSVEHNTTSAMVRLPSDGTAQDGQSQQRDYSFEYQLLDRLRTDCNYFLGSGNRAEKHLWAGSVRSQIAKMRELYKLLPEKPEWLTAEQIEHYAEEMSPRYEVVVYHPTENSFDEKLDYQTIEEAERIAQRYLDGTMDGDDLAYGGAAVYDLQSHQLVRSFGHFPQQEPLIITEPTTYAKAENYRITSEMNLGGPKARFQSNLEAIKLLKYLEETAGQATPEQQQVLARYVGWGGLADAFETSKASWHKEYEQLKQALTPEEYMSARASVLNAHYTSATVIQAIYAALTHLGFSGGRILEPACGVGKMFGMLPESMRKSQLFGVELDSISGRIARQLYPKAEITVAGFETFDKPEFFDVVIGNVSFGQYQVDDKSYNKLGFSIHNYFLAKSIDQVHSGGIVACITSRYTLDAKDSTVRRYLAQRAELLGAIRLPNTAFAVNAGTSVVSDILFLQKRERILDVAPEWTQLGRTDDGFLINQYFVDHPEMVLGTPTSENTQYGREEYTVVPNPANSLDLLLADAIQNIQGVFQSDRRDLDVADIGAPASSLPASPDVRNYSYTVIHGCLYYRDGDEMRQVDISENNKGRVQGLVALRDCLRQLISMQMDASTHESDITAQRERLNRLYDTFLQQYGLIRDKKNEKCFEDDSSYPLLASLEEVDTNGQLIGKAAIFSRRTIKPHEVVTSVGSASEALAVSIAEKAMVDMPYMMQLSGQTEAEIIEELRGVIFLNPEYLVDNSQPRYLTADEYLSGNVRVKLRTAQHAAEQNLDYQINVEALKKAQPKDLEAAEIEVRLGATWIDKKYVQEFMYETFGTPSYLKRGIRVNYSSLTGEWRVEGKSTVLYNDVLANTVFGTSRVNAYKLLEESLNLRDIRVYDTLQDPDGNERRVLNAKETTLAAQKQQAIRNAFRDWLWKDPARRQTLVAQYNETWNATRVREYDGQHLVFGGINAEITLRPHQLGAIAHIIYGGNTLLAHEVGAGKTYEMVAAAMESKRLGLCTKSLFVVPNHLIDQWAAEFLKLYPAANVLAAKKKDFEPKNRKRFCARIATGDYDAIIIGHSQFEKIPISQERQRRLLQEQLEEITQGIAEAKHNDGEHFTVKQMERVKKSLEVKLRKLQDGKAKDDVVTFEELGIDRLYVDEAHHYKNLFLFTKMRNVAGLSTADAQKSSDMFAKCRYMDELTGNRGVVFATGTPVSNSMTELYTMQRYLQYDRLQELNLVHFDSWASSFGETVTALELAPEGTGYRARTRFSKFYNLPELMTLFREVADIKTADQLDLPTPHCEYHTVVSQPTENQKEMVAALSERASAVHSGSVDPSQDNMLKITSDGRKLGLDQRIINPLLPDVQDTKVNKCVENIVRIWNEGKEERLTQLVFCDISTPKKNTSKKTEAQLDETEVIKEISIYDDIRDKLILQGVPNEEIAYIHDANTEAKKEVLFEKVRKGEVRVLLGSTQKMGAGTNVQDRLIALHDLDCPWRPGDLAQREGRIVRQGNRNKVVHVYRYCTQDTFDAYLWQTVETKQKYISQIMTSKTPVRACEDVDDTVLSYAEIKALCAGDPRIKERMDLDVDIAKLKMLRAEHNSKRYRLEDQLLKYFPERIGHYERYIAALQSDMETAAAHAHSKDSFAGMMLYGELYKDKESAGNKLISIIKETKSGQLVKVGNYRGFEISLETDAWKKESKLTLNNHAKSLVILGTDPKGNITRIDNALAQFPQRIEQAQAELENLRQQKMLAEQEVRQTWPYDNELEKKMARLTELDIALNMEEKAPRNLNQILDDVKHGCKLGFQHDVEAEYEL